MPSYLKALLTKQEEEPTSFHTSYENRAQSGYMFNHPKELEQSHKLEMFKHLEDIVHDEEINEKFESEDSDKTHFFQNLKDVFKNFYAKQEEAEEKKRKLSSQPHPSVFLNMNDIEKELKDAYTSHQVDDDQENELKMVDENKGGVFFSLVELLKEYADEGNKANINTNEVLEHSENSPEVVYEENKNMLNELLKSNVSVKAVDEDGGIYFKLAQEDKLNQV